MQHKKLTTLGCLLVLGAFVAPGAMAHYDTGAHPVPYASTGLVADDYTLEAPSVDPLNPVINPASAGGNTDRVSGWYYGSAGPYVQVEDDSGTLTFLSAFGGMLCDAEVLLVGDDNEEVVDGLPSGVTPDGIFNDGGNGGACHVTSYGNEAWNTGGCTYDNAFAEDAVFGSEVWISTSCNWRTPTDTTGPGIEDVIVTGALCVVNEVLDPNTNPDVIVDCGEYVADCINPALVNAADNLCEPETGQTFACGADSTSDATEFGEGDGYQAAAPPATDDDLAEHHAPGDFASTPGVPFPNSGGECPDDEVASVFVWTSVAVHVDSAGGVGHTADAESFLENAAAGTYGWIS